MLFAGGLLAIAAALSGLMRGTVLSIAVLSVTAGLILAEVDAIHVYAGDAAVVHLFELALIVTLLSDGLFVDREMLVVHWGPVARALVIAMPLTLVLLALAAKVLFSTELGGGLPAWLGAGGDGPGGDLVGGHLSAGSGVRAPRPQPRVRPERRARAAVRPLLHHPRLGRRMRGPRPRSWPARPPSARWSGSFSAKRRGASRTTSPAAGSSAATRASTPSASACSPTASRTSPSATG